MKYELTKDLETGNVTIDNEHRQLLQAVNSLMDACKSGQGRNAVMPTLKFLLDYVEKHFTHEEQLQIKAAYPGFADHKAFHMNYKAQLKEIASQLSDDTLTIANMAKLNNHIATLVSHIRIDDKKLGAFLNKG